MENYFDKSTFESLKTRINKLTPESQRVWGKMDVAQMMNHLSRPLEVILGTRKTKGFPPIIGWLIKPRVLKLLTSDGTFKRDGFTPSEFKVTDSKVFETEKQNLIKNMEEVYNHGQLPNKVWNHSTFGILTQEQVSTMQIKHIDHHLTQFGV